MKFLTILVLNLIVLSYFINIKIKIEPRTLNTVYNILGYIQHIVSRINKFLVVKQLYKPTMSVCLSVCNAFRKSSFRHLQGYIFFKEADREGGIKY